MRWIYLSPHFDDAVLSCGGLIWEQTRQGIPVEIWTVCAGDAPTGELSMLAQVCHFQWGMKTAEEVLKARRAENQEAADLLAATTVDFSIPDCIYRRSPQGELLYPDDIFVPVHPSEADLPAEIAAALASELMPGDLLAAPLSVGGHPDHVITTRAAELLGLPVTWYEDVPYLIDHPEQRAPAVHGMSASLQPISREGLEAWQAAIAAYGSQVQVLFGSMGDCRQKIESYWLEKQGICLWQSE